MNTIFWVCLRRFREVNRETTMTILLHRQYNISHKCSNLPSHVAYQQRKHILLYVFDKIDDKKAVLAN